jgi:hypothetical protein
MKAQDCLQLVTGEMLINISFVASPAEIGLSGYVDHSINSTIWTNQMLLFSFLLKKVNLDVAVSAFALPFSSVG